MKEETIEEAARRIFGDDEDGNYLEKKAFIKGVKLGQEKMFEIMDLYTDDVMGGCTLRAKEWFEKNKTK